MSDALDDLRSRIASNTLTASQQAALVAALDVVAPLFPTPDELSNSIPSSEGILAREWIAALYAIAAQAGDGFPVVTVGTAIAADAAALEALDVVGLPTGAPAVVQSYGAVFALGASGTPLAPGVVLPASDGRVWLRGASLIAAAALAQAAWVVDPADGDDEASGLDASHALQSYAEIARRWGTTRPVLAQATGIDFLGDNVASDRVTCEPSLEGDAGLTIRGTLTQVATARIGVFTAKNRAAATKNTITAQGQSGAFWTPFVGLTVHDVTSGAQFFVDADLGGGLASISEPIALPVSTSPTRGAVANGDALVIYRASLLYVDSLALPDGGVGDGAGRGMTIRQLNVTSELFLVLGPWALFAECTFSNCIVSTRLDNLVGRMCVFASCYFPALNGDTGPFQGTAQFFAGVVNGRGNTFSDGSVLDGDILVNLRSHSSGGQVLLGCVYFGQWFEYPAVWTTFVAQAFSFGGPFIWGPNVIGLTEGEQFALVNTTAVDALLCTAGLRLNTLATGYAFNPATGQFSAGAIALTPAAIDANGSIQNPATGARFYIAA